MEKDITTNNLIDNDDVFADIANVNIFDGVRLIAPEDLESVPTGSSYRDLDGKHHRLFRDTLKRVQNLGGCVAFLGCESQTKINNIMPVRDMGYTYTSYMKQIHNMMAENNKNGNCAYAKVLHDDQRLMPVATFVLYFGKDKWKRPLSLMDILDIPEEGKEFWESLIVDYRLNIIHMADQPKEIREKYRSDYRIIADYLAYHKNKAELETYLRKDSQRIIHVEQLLDMLYALSGDERFEVIKSRYLESNDKEECDTMCLLLDMCEEEGIQKGVSLAKQILQLNAKGKTAEEIADQLDVEMTMVEDILDFN